MKNNFKLVIINLIVLVISVGCNNSDIDNSTEVDQPIVAIIDITGAPSLKDPTIMIIANISSPIATYSLSDATSAVGNTYTFENVGGSVASCTIAPVVSGIVISIVADNVATNVNTCKISGVAKVIQPTTIHTVTATNDKGTGSTQISIRVKGTIPKLSNITKPLIYAVSSASITPTFFVNTEEPVTSCIINPPLPGTLTIGTGTSAGILTCKIYGIPSVPAAKTTYTVTGTSSSGSDTATVSIEIIGSDKIPNLKTITNGHTHTSVAVGGDVAITNGNTTTYYVGSPVTTKFSLAGGEFIDGDVNNGCVVVANGVSVAGSVTSGSLPAGLTMTVSGTTLTTRTCVISGTPTARSKQTIRTAYRGKNSAGTQTVASAAVITIQVLDSVCCMPLSDNLDTFYNCID